MRQQLHESKDRWARHPQRSLWLATALELRFDFADLLNDAARFGVEPLTLLRHR
jgi:hypothetical protein